MANDLTVPAVPGLLRRCSPVWVEPLPGERVQAVVTGASGDDGYPWTVAPLVYDEAWPDCLGYPTEDVVIRNCQLSELHLDLTDPTGRAHLVAWLASQPAFFKVRSAELDGVSFADQEAGERVTREVLSWLAGLNRAVGEAERFDDMDEEAIVCLRDVALLTIAALKENA